MESNCHIDIRTNDEIELMGQNPQDLALILSACDRNENVFDAKVAKR